MSFARLPLTTLMLAVLLLTSCTGIKSSSTPSTPTTEASATLSRLATTCRPQQGDVGIAGGAELLGLSDADLDRTLTAVHDAGATQLRVGVDWSAIEAQQGIFDWSTSDRVVQAALRHGLTPLAIVLYTPPWAVAPGLDPANNKSRPADPNAFGQFAGLAASRYAANITDWEIWNEPNIAEFFAPEPDVSQYADLLRAAYVSIHTAQPHAVVITGGLSPAGDTDTSISPVTFLQKLYSSGAGKFFDAVGMHPYSYPALPTDPASADYNAFLRMDLMRQAMIGAGDSSKKIWITEFGAPTGTSEQAVSEKVQADTIKTGICVARESGYIASTFIYTIRDQGTDISNREDNFGLLRTDFSAKPSYAALKSVTVG